MNGQVRIYKDTSTAHFQAKRGEGHIAFSAEVSDAFEATVNLAEGQLPSLHPKSLEKNYVACDIEESEDSIKVTIGTNTFNCKDLFIAIPLTPTVAIKKNIPIKAIFQE